MKQIHLNRLVAVAMSLVLFALPGCREFTTINRPYQRVLINDFSAPVRTLLPPYTDYPNSLANFPNSLTLRVSGTISRPVTLAVDQLTPGQGRQRVRRDTLAAGTYTNKLFGGDYYSKDDTELTVTGTPGATGSLTIEWYRQ